MTPIEYFEKVWDRCELLSNIYLHLNRNTSAIINAEELLRAEWITRVSALDLYVRELVLQGMMEIFRGQRIPTNAYRNFKLPHDAIHSINQASDTISAQNIYELHIRDQLCLISYQKPDKIADGIRLISEVRLWHQVALQLGSDKATADSEAKRIKQSLSIIADRRNKMVHQGDLKPDFPRQPWDISKNDIDTVRDQIADVVYAINEII